MRGSNSIEGLGCGWAAVGTGWIAMCLSVLFQQWCAVLLSSVSLCGQICRLLAWPSEAHEEYFE